MRMRQYLMVVVIVTTLVLSIAGQTFAAHRYAEVLQDGRASQSVEGHWTVWFPGGPSNWTLDIDLVITGGALDLVVSIFDMYWEDYEANDDPQYGALYEFFGVTEINETLPLDLQDFGHMFILVRGTNPGLITMDGHVIARCDYVSQLLYVPYPKELVIVSVVTLGFLVVDLSVSWYRPRVE